MGISTALLNPFYFPSCYLSPCFPLFSFAADLTTFLLLWAIHLFYGALEYKSGARNALQTLGTPLPQNWPSKLEMRWINITGCFVLACCATDISLHHNAKSSLQLGEAGKERREKKKVLGKFTSSLTVGKSTFHIVIVLFLVKCNLTFLVYC